MSTNKSLGLSIKGTSVCTLVNNYIKSYKIKEIFGKLLMSYTFTAVAKRGSITKFEMGSSQTCTVLLLWHTVKPWVLAFYTNRPIENFTNKLYTSEEDLVRVGLDHLAPVICFAPNHIMS